MPPDSEQGLEPRLPFGADRRLRRQRDIDATFRGGDKFVNQRLVVWLRNSGASHSRLGLSVSRKVGNAVVRNRVKRCLREAFRRLSPQLARPWDTMVVVRPAAAPRNLAQATEALSRIFRRAEGQQRRTTPGKRR